DKRAALSVLDALAESAAPDTIVLSAPAAALVERRFQVETLSRGFRLVGLERTGFGLGARALSRFVGRDRELSLLRDATEHARRGEGRTVGVAGEPGVGKSRLLYE